MILIQPILIVMMALSVILYFRFFRTQTFDRLAVLAIGCLGMVLVARPDWSSQLANLFGVGRGADLISYFGIVGLSFVWVLTYSKIRRVEDKLTDVARTLALLNAKLEEQDEG